MSYTNEEIKEFKSKFFIQNIWRLIDINTDPKIVEIPVKSVESQTWGVLVKFYDKDANVQDLANKFCAFEINFCKSYPDFFLEESEALKAIENSLSDILKDLEEEEKKLKHKAKELLYKLNKLENKQI